MIDKDQRPLGALIDQAEMIQSSKKFAWLKDAIQVWLELVLRSRLSAAFPPQNVAVSLFVIFTFAQF